MSQEVKIRFAEDSDAEFLAENVYVSKDILLRKIEWREFIVAEKEGLAVGFLQFEYLWSLVPYIALIRVLPKYRKNGIGTKLLEFIENFLREKGHEEIYSSSQADESEPQNWHRHIGFEECGFISGINEGIGEVFFRKKI